MAGPAEKAVFSERSSHPESKEDRFWRWFAVSAVAHGILILSFFLMPYSSFRRAVSYPVYSVELVGGEKLGGGGSSTAVTPAPEPKRETTKKEPVAPPPRAEVKEAKKEKPKAKELPAKAAPTVALKTKSDSKKREEKPEPKQEQPKAEGLSGEVREKLIQAAVERVKERAAIDQKKGTGESVSPGPSEGAGASAPGVGGSGGGVVKGVEFINYLNRMRSVIRERWTWVGKRSDLEVKVRFGIQENGEIVGLKIVQRSGDASYDDSVVRALKRASPLPPPPESYRKDFMDVELTFQPKDLGG